GPPAGATPDLRDPTPGGRHPPPPPRAGPQPPSPCQRGNRWFDPGERTRHGRRADHPRVQPPAALVLVDVLADPVLVLGGLHDHVVLAVVAARLDAQERHLTGGGEHGPAHPEEMLVRRADRDLGLAIIAVVPVGRVHRLHAGDRQGTDRISGEDPQLRRAVLVLVRPHDEAIADGVGEQLIRDHVGDVAGHLPATVVDVDVEAAAEQHLARRAGRDLGHGGITGGDVILAHDLVAGWGARAHRGHRQPPVVEVTVVVLTGVRTHRVAGSVGHYAGDVHLVGGITDLRAGTDHHHVRRAADGRRLLGEAVRDRVVAHDRRLVIVRRRRRAGGYGECGDADHHD